MSEAPGCPRSSGCPGGRERLWGRESGWREREDASLEPALSVSCPFAGCELNQERPTWTFKPQKVGKQDCALLAEACRVAAFLRSGDGAGGRRNLARHAGAGGIAWSPHLEPGFLLRPRPGGEDAPPVPFSTPLRFPGEKAKEEVNVVEILPLGKPEDRRGGPSPWPRFGPRSSRWWLPEGLGNPGSSPRRPCSGLSPCVQMDTRWCTGSYRRSWCPREIFFV